MIETLQSIYSRLGDELSQAIYIDRLNYSITGDNNYLEKMIERAVRSQDKWKSFCGLLREKAAEYDLYLFGAGIWGRTLFQETRGQIQWKGVIDNQPEGKTVADLAIMTLRQFMERHDKKAAVVISSYKNRKEMSEQLQEAGFSPERIIDGGGTIYQLTEGAIYFDLKELGPCAAQEIFVDAGGFDGETTERFLQWCKGNGYAYCFEADLGNIAAIQKNFAGYNKREIVPKALWSETRILSMHMKGSPGSSVSPETNGGDVQAVEAIALDDFLKGSPVTFLKMDIEGAELEAIRGARGAISQQHPKLAISVYHKPEDIWILPKQILEYYPEYRFYLRHYSFGWYDTVLYAVPQDLGEQPV